MKEAVKKSLLVQRSTIEKRLDSARLYISNLIISSEAQFEALKVRQEQLPKLYEAFNDIQAKFDAEGVEFDARDDFETKYYETLGSFRATLRQNQALFASHEYQSQHCETLLGVQSPIQLKLPEIRLSQFSGDIKSWSSFRDTFKALVIDNRSISDINKFYYLINSLDGEAKLIVQNIPISAANFPVAWAQLESRYDDFRALVNTHVHALLNPPSLVHGSASSLQTYLDHFSSNVEALKALGSRVNVQDLLLSSLLSRSLDQHILQDWEMSVDRNSLPCFEDLTKFVQKRCKALAAATPGEPSSSLAAPPAVKHRKPLTIALPPRTRVCPCGKNHELYTCKEFIELPRTKRFTFVKENNLCFNCLRSRTANHQCSSLRCKMCDGSHHSLLHRESSPSPANTCAHGVNTRHHKDEPSCLLATAIVRVKDARDNDAGCTALLDSGSDVNLITHKFAKSLGLPMKKTQSVIAGISSSESVSQSRIQATVSAKDGKWMKKLIFLVVPRITHDLPAASFECDSWNLPLHIDLADPCFNRSKPIDMLLGANTFFSVLRPGKLSRDFEHPLLQETSLGWLISGQLPVNIGNVTMKATCGVTHIQSPKAKPLNRFREPQRIPPHPSASRKNCFHEKHYVQTASRNSTRWYINKGINLSDAPRLRTWVRKDRKNRSNCQQRSPGNRGRVGVGDNRAASSYFGPPASKPRPPPLVKVYVPATHAYQQATAHFPL